MDLTKKNYKYCMVPKCGNTTVTTPNKLFITLPSNPEVRTLWQKAMKRETFLSAKTKKFCCEDHFNLKEDTENFFYLKTMKSGKVILKPGVIPHIFDCQNASSEQKPNKNSSQFDQEDKPILANLFTSQVDSSTNTIDTPERYRYNNYMIINPIIKKEYEDKSIQVDNPMVKVEILEFPNCNTIIKKQYENKASQVSIETKVESTQVDMLNLSRYSTVIKKECEDKSIQVNIKPKVISKAIQCDILVVRNKRRKFAVE